MENLVQLTEKIAAKAVMADPSDLNTLADLHSGLQEMSELATRQLAEQGKHEAVVSVAQSAEKLIEQIILREVKDADACLKTVNQTIQDLQAMIASVATSVPPAPTQEDVAVPAPADPAADAAREAQKDAQAAEFSAAIDAPAPAATAPAAPAPETKVPEAPAPAPVVAAPAPVAVPAPTPAPAAVHTEAPHIDDELPINSEDSSLAQEFISEARSHIDTAEAEILNVEENPDNLEAVNAIFRAFHTIKGVAGFLNLKQIGALAHTSENLLDLARKGKLKLTGNAVDLVLEAIDGMKILLSGLESALTGGTAIPVEASLPGLITRLVAFINGDTSVTAAAPAKSSSAKTPSATKSPTTAAPAASAPTAAPAAPVQAPVADVAKPDPVAAQASVAAPVPAPVAAPSPTPAEKPAAEHEAAPKAEHEAAKNNGNHAGTQAEATVKVATDRLDNLINMVGELVIAQAMVAQDCLTYAANNPRLGRNMSHLSKITRELQDLSMSMRMVPIQGVFQKMARLARDLARKSMKEIDFQMVGGETELDRNIVEAISDPLVHMVRNAADHGIESPEDRAKAGKPREGKITLRAYHQAGNIVIEIVDDGKGLNKTKIRKKAVEAGVITPEQELSEQDIFRLIFHPGLSTADKITDVSGRGVGMDVVRKNVEQLRGRIDITSTEGVGSTFTIRLPLTLAVIDGLVVKIGAERYIIPITSIEQSMRPKADQISTVQNRGEQCLIRGQILPLFRLYKLFNVTPRSEDPCEALVVIVQDDQRRCCLMVDELLGQQQVVIKSMGEAVGQVRGISGGAILGDGCVSLILDVPGIVSMATQR